MNNLEHDLEQNNFSNLYRRSLILEHLIPSIPKPNLMETIVKTELEDLLIKKDYEFEESD